jgi:hypothetical protein
MNTVARDLIPDSRGIGIPQSLRDFFAAAFAANILMKNTCKVAQNPLV